MSAFIILRKKEKKEKARNPHLFGSSGRRCLDPVPFPLLSVHTWAASLYSAAQRPQGLEALGDTEESVSSG